MPVFDGVVQSFGGGLSGGVTWRTLRVVTSPDLGTDETYSHSWDVVRECDFGGRDRHESLFDAGGVRSLSLIGSTEVDDSSNSAQIEIWLSFGANRWEVGRNLLLKPALRLAMLPTITQMR